jgi:HD-GYP domain-containing protein (c-di-GMP phosphodiesterase class II)
MSLLAAVIFTLCVACACLFILVYYLFSIKKLNQVAARLQKGDLSMEVPISRLPVLREACRHYSFLSSAVADLKHLEKYQQKMLTYEKKELEHLLDKENLSQQLEKQLEETKQANLAVSNLNVDLAEKNRSLNEAINRLSALNQISRQLGMEHDRNEIYRMLVSLPREYSQGIKEEHAGRRRVSMDGGIAGWVARNRKPLLIKDFKVQDLFSTRSSLGYNRDTAISAPIMTKNDLIGVITLINKDNGQPFIEDELTLLATMASEAAMALHNALLVEKIQNSYFSMVQSLITAVEAKDVYTRGHSERVTQYSLLIGEQMNLSLEELTIIQQAGVLHDIGKITVELSILNKPTPLNDEEYNKIKAHPAVGYRILEPIDFEDRVKQCVLQHHERPDGKGYPNGTASDNIILEAKILAAADAFDAMTTKRPYREPLSISTALKEMENCSGTQFDPEVVYVLKRIVNTMTSTGAMAAMYS